MAVPISKQQMACDEATAKRLIADNWNSVQESVAEVAKQCGRDTSEIRVVGVTKYVDAEITGWLVDAGCHDLGENRPQLLESKFEALARPEIRWHQIGNLQRNKVRRLLPANPMIHAITSQRLLDALHQECTLQSRSIEGLIEVNISEEEAKTGLPVNQLESILRHWQDLPQPKTGGLQIRGLMAMAGWGTDQDAARRQFAKLAEIRDRIQNQLAIELPELSMGMSGDYPAAIAEGATLIRIGTRFFQGVLPTG
ncbi:YggS family pyridoxal phosphate-dependent enzyme [Rhodopirellula halodulae]|uniref:YggS family pyridoxal phosphate-dependent enzyme n=1 Tax=Rhodopirellula halodulae TaxID=2894198 RepID=UPI0028F45998|nr:YggS family pyridoxal phosphate-dependent enzyme [Rhodopirellula sp. JC737]MCC9655220.1 YggS family pyridoxal phosphate-dependent enzyme [Rhodopirellula sp. JC737]